MRPLYFFRTLALITSWTAVEGGFPWADTRFSGEQDWPGPKVGWRVPCETLYQGGIERDDIHQARNPSFFLTMCPRILAWGNLRLGSRNSSTGHSRVSGGCLRSGRVGRQCVVLPVVVGEPGVVLGYSHQIARAG